MGSFAGHFIPGIAFIFCGLSIFLNELVIFTKGENSDGKGFLTETVPWWRPFGPRRNQILLYLTPWPIVTLGLLVLVVFLVLFELAENSPPRPNNLQHATMFTGFGIALLGELLERVAVFMPRSTGLLLLLANVTQLLLFTAHVADSMLEQRLHTLILVCLLLLIMVNIAIIAKPSGEMKMLIGFIATCEGSALAFAGVKLKTINLTGGWGPSKEQDNHETVMLTQMQFSWILATISIIFFCMGNVGLRYRRRYGDHTLVSSTES